VRSEHHRAGSGRGRCSPPGWQTLPGNSCTRLGTHGWGCEHGGTGSSTMDPGGSQSLGSPTKRRESGWERKPKNKPTRAEEGNRRRRGKGSSEQLPVVSVLTLWTPACYCHCGTKHRTAAQVRAHRWPGAASHPVLGTVMKKPQQGYTPGDRGGSSFSPWCCPTRYYRGTAKARRVGHLPNPALAPGWTGQA
jgi:hypothetical protein